MSELPPRPPFPPPPDSGTLQRYGIRWRGPTEPISEPMPDGYWTPWHAADAEIARLRAAATKASAELRHAYRDRETGIDPNLVARAIEILERAALEDA